MVQRSWGRLLRTHRFDPTATSFAVSRDGSYLAENTTQSTIAADNSQSIIYGPDGSVVAHLADLVVGFSWDCSTVVAQDELSGPAMVVARRTATIVVPAPPPPPRPPPDVRFR